MLGGRVSIAQIEKHNGNTDQGGQPTYTVDADWDVLVANWPCQRGGARGQDRVGNETTRGRQVSAVQNYEYTGDPYPLIEKQVDTECRIAVDGQTFGITAIRGLEPMSLQAVISVGIES